MTTSTRKNFTPVIKAYILDTLDSEGYENCEYFIPFNSETTDDQKVKFLNAVIRAEKSHYLKRENGAGFLTQTIVKDWLQGLPTCLSVAYTNYEIEQLLRQWGILNESATEEKIEKEVELYWERLAVNIIKLFNKIK